MCQVEYERMNETESTQATEHRDISILDAHVVITVFPWYNPNL